MILRSRLLLAAALLAGSSAAVVPAMPAPGASAAPAGAMPAMLPARRLVCSLARATRYDGSRPQRLDELGLEGDHLVELALPSVPVRTTPPPEAIDPPEPVAAGTGILADPDGIARLANRIDRVIDLWPERVELATHVSERLSQLILITAFDAAAGTAQMQLARSNETLVFDPDEVYLGSCKVSIDAGKPAAS